MIVCDVDKKIIEGDGQTVSVFLPETGEKVLLDLCPDCLKGFMDFVKNMKNPACPTASISFDRTAKKPKPEKPDTSDK